MNKWSRGDRVTFFLLALLGAQIMGSIRECWKNLRAIDSLGEKIGAAAHNSAAMGKTQWDAMIEMQRIMSSSLESNLYALSLLFLISMLVAIAIGRQYQKNADFKEYLDEKQSPSNSLLY